MCHAFGAKTPSRYWAPQPAHDRSVTPPFHPYSKRLLLVTPLKSRSSKMKAELTKVNLMGGVFCGQGQKKCQVWLPTFCVDHQRDGFAGLAGYTSRVLGCRSNCRLRDVSHIPEDLYQVEVVPGLPQVQVTTSLPKAASFTSMEDSASVVTSATTVLYAGQRSVSKGGQMPWGV